MRGINKDIDIRCIGCRNVNGICIIKYSKFYIQYCPCINCIVKVMCRNFCTERKEVYKVLASKNQYNLINVMEEI